MIFIDTSAFLAIENQRDTYHSRAISFRDHCLKKGDGFLTTDYVLDETYTIIRLRATHATAVQFGEVVRKSRLIRVEHLTPEILEEAWHIFKQYSDHMFSYTDCTSFAIMERLRLDTAFTFDADFQEYGQFLVKPL